MDKAADNLKNSCKNLMYNFRPHKFETINVVALKNSSAISPQAEGLARLKSGIIESVDVRRREGSSKAKWRIGNGVSYSWWVGKGRKPFSARTGRLSCLFVNNHTGD